MDSNTQSFPAQLSSLWTRLNASEKLIVIASIIILIVALVVWIGVTRQPNYALLYGNLEPADAGRVIGDLEGQNIQYSVKDNGTAVYVPANKVDEIRISLASDGFIPSGTTGYEILNESPLGMSDRSQRQRITQALEGELARTLMSLQEVSSARVHLTVPQPSPFISEQTEPVASVVLNIIPAGSTLSRDKIGAVRTFVAGAISADSDNVTIIDQNMNLLTGPTASQPGGLLPTQEETRRNYELQRASDIRSLLEKRFGVGKVAVSFSCEMDFDQVQTESISYEPVSGTDHGVLVGEERTEDSTSGGGYSAPVGIPGTESNIPSYVGTSNEPFESDSATETKNYEISTTHETRVQTPGTVERCSVGVIIDSGDRNPTDIGAAEITEVKELVAAAGLLDISTTDNLTVAFSPFDTSLQEELASQKAELDKDAIGALVVQIVLALLVLAIFFLVLLKFLKPIERTFAMAGAVESEEHEVELPEADKETLEKLRIRDEIERLIREDPAGAAKVIQTWLKE